MDVNFSTSTFYSFCDFIIVQDLSVKGPTFETIKSLDDLFPKKAEVFNLSIPHYGSIGRVSWS